MGLFDFFPTSKKEKNRARIRENQRKGKAGEDLVRMNYELQGYEVERTGKGHDFRVRRRDLFTGRVVESKVVEVKTGKAKLSQLQEKSKKKRSNYKVERVEPFLY